MPIFTDRLAPQPAILLVVNKTSLLAPQPFLLCSSSHPHCSTRAFQFPPATLPISFIESFHKPFDTGPLRGQTMRRSIKQGDSLRRASFALFSACLSVTFAFPRTHADADTFDIVISSGRVMDPESGLDAIRNVGIRDGKIGAISDQPLQAKQTINAHGLVVAPGFIDMHEHGQEPRNYEFQAHDGVTTSLELEAGVADIDAFYAKREGHSLINYGASVGHIPVRMQVMHDAGSFLPISDAAHREATPTEQQQIDAAIDRGLERGALAVGMGINYTPGASHAEIMDVFKVAAAHGTSVHVHLRYNGLVEPTTGLAALQEVVADAAATGAPLHVVHITSMGLRETPRLLDVIRGAQKRGLDVTTEAYPYVAGSTGLESAIFDPGWQERMGITYHDLQWAKTGERLTAET